MTVFSKVLLAVLCSGSEALQIGSSSLQPEQTLANLQESFIQENAAASAAFLRGEQRASVLESNFNADEVLSKIFDGNVATNSAAVYAVSMKALVPSGVSTEDFHHLGTMIAEFLQSQPEKYLVLQLRGVTKKKLQALSNEPFNFPTIITGIANNASRIRICIGYDSLLSTLHKKIDFGSVSFFGTPLKNFQVVSRTFRSARTFSMPTVHVSDDVKFAFYTMGSIFLNNI